MSPGDSMLARLAAGGRIAARIMVVVAHPDDETLGAGAQLCRFGDASLVHVTDGAPRDGQDSRNYGFASVAEYAAARRAELAAALRAGGAEHLRTFGLGIPDQEAWLDLAGLTRRMVDLLRAEQPVAVFAHAYEGGHPDHDAAAFAVHCACRLIDKPPAVIETALYHRRGGRLASGEFLDPQSPLLPGPLVFSMALDQDGIRRKRRMIGCFTTQRWLLEQFDLSTERFRIAPEHDFRDPPHPGTLHYETLGWGIRGETWRRAAAEALRRLGLDTDR